MHIAGKDLTGDLEQAPHGTDLLKRFPIVGMLDEASQGPTVVHGAPGITLELVR